MPKQLIPIANKPVLQYVLEAIAAVGIIDVGLVVGHWHHRIAETIGDGSRFGLQISYIGQDRPHGLADCVRIARPFLGDEDFIMHLGDNLLPAGISSYITTFRASRPAAQLIVRKVVDPSKFGVAQLGPSGRVQRVVEKPRQPSSDLALVGVYFFTPAIHDAVLAIRPSKRGELEITDAIQWLITGGREVRAVEHHGYWKDTGSVPDVLECNRYLLSQLRPVVAGEVDHASEIGSNAVVEPGARIIRTRVIGPCIVGAGAVVTDSQIGPYASVGRDCVVRDTQLSDSIVMTGAPHLISRDLRHVLVGPGATTGAAEVSQGSARADGTQGIHGDAAVTPRHER